MSLKKVINRPIASLNLPKPVPALINYATGMVDAMTGNPAFTTPVPPLATVKTEINGLQIAETAVLARTRGTAETRNEKKAVLVTSLQQLRGYVQTVADANVENAASIIRSAGIAVKRTHTPAPRVFAAKQGAVSGSAKLVAATAGRRASYEWEYSVDGGKTWVAAPTTLQAKTTIVGLTPGAIVQFRYRPVLKTGEGDWSQPVSLIVH